MNKQRVILKINQKAFKDVHMVGYTVLIPAYKPNERFVELVARLKTENIEVIAVDDGSGPDYSTYFEQAQKLGAFVLRHNVNKGKGAALKTGIASLMNNEAVLGIVTADADGQHTVKDIRHIIAEMKANPGVFVIGARSFLGDVPLRSRFGNSVTRSVFRFATGLKINDTQTGLRGLPKILFGQLLKLTGDRYEYEMDMLLNIQRWGVDYLEVPIETVYIEGNQGSHFNPLRDSWKIYSKIVKFGISGILSFLIDYGAFALLGNIFHVQYWGSYAIARVISSYANYSINRHVVFKSGEKISIIKYYLLVFAVMIAGSAGVSLLTWIGIHNLIAKPIIDIPLFIINFYIQRKYIFKSKLAVE